MCCRRDRKEKVLGQKGSRTVACKPGTCPHRKHATDRMALGQATRRRVLAANAVHHRSQPLGSV